MAIEIFYIFVYNHKLNQVSKLDLRVTSEMILEIINQYGNNLNVLLILLYFLFIDGKYT